MTIGKDSHGLYIQRGRCIRPADVDWFQLACSHIDQNPFKLISAKTFLKISKVLLGLANLHTRWLFAEINADECGMGRERAEWIWSGNVNLRPCIQLVQ